MPAVRFENNWATRGKCRRCVTARSRKCQREITCAKYGNRPYTNFILAQVWARSWLAIRQGLIDPSAIKIAAAQHLREQPELIGRAGTLALDSSCRQRRLCADEVNELGPESINLFRDGIEKGCPLCR
ncbi:hypothetical protein D3C75_456100 [compost metagenome]